MPSHPVPQWLDEPFLQRLLTKLMSDKEFKIVSSNVTAVSNIDDPFASPVFRVTATTSSRFPPAVGAVAAAAAAASSAGPVDTVHSFVLKVPAEQRTTLFDNEIRFYSSTLEEMQRLLTHCDGNIQLGPRVLHYTSGAEAVLVLEDLSVEAFAPLQQSLSLDASISVIYKLAKWHAASIFLSRDNHDLQYSEGIFNAQRCGDQLAFMFANFEYFAAEVQTWDGCAVYAPKFAALVSKFHERGQAIFTAKAGGFNVLNHGGLGLKNVLLREDGRGINVKFIDFQYCVWATPAIDLFSVLHLVCSPDVSTDRRNDLIQFYFKELTLSLNKMGYLRTPPTLQQLQIELLQNGFLEVIVTTCLLPFYINGEMHDLSAANLPSVRQSVYANEHYRALVKAQLPYFLHKGFLN